MLGSLAARQAETLGVAADLFFRGRDAVGQELRQIHAESSGDSF